VKAIKVRIYPSNSQKVLLEKHFGCCRFAYNFGLNIKVKTYTETKKSVGIFAIQKEIPKLYEEKPWIKEVNSQSIQQSLKDLDSAFSHFFRQNNSFPKFKSRKNPKQSFRVPQHFEISKDCKAIKIPKVKWIKFRDKFNIPDNSDFRNVTISRDGNQYFASICYDDKKVKPQLIPIQENRTLGIDLGVRTLATYSDGTKIDNPKHFKKYQDKLAEEQRKLSKKENKTTNSYRKQKEKVQKVYRKIANTRRDFLHKLTTSLVDNQNWDVYAMEDLAVQKLEQDNYTSMSRAIGDAGWRMIRTMMDYKCSERGKNFLTIGRFDPSSKTCSVCGNIYPLERDEKEWKCEKCGTVHDRDVNAAKNIRNFALIKSSGKNFGEAILLEPPWL
jgi:putative transposase